MASDPPIDRGRSISQVGRAVNAEYIMCILIAWCTDAPLFLCHLGTDVACVPHIHAKHEYRRTEQMNTLYTCTTFAAWLHTIRVKRQ